MRVSKIMVAALGAGLALTPVAHAQEFGRDFDQMRADRSQSDSVQLRFSTSLGGSRHEEDAGPRLALRLSQNAGAGEMRNLDVVSYSFNASEGERLATPFTLNAADNGGGLGDWIWNHKILVGIGVGLAVWGIVDANNDDDETSGCNSNSRC